MHASKVPARARQTRLSLTPLVAMLAIVLGVMDLTRTLLDGVKV